MTLPAKPVGLMNFLIYPHFFSVEHLGVTTDTIFLNHSDPRFLNENNLRFGSQSEDGCVSKTVFPFKIIVTEEIIMRNVTIVTIGYLSMGTMSPGSKLRSHNMTVYACLWVIGQIRCCVRYIKNVKTRPYKYAEGYYYRNPPKWGRSEPFYQFSHCFCLSGVLIPFSKRSMALNNRIVSSLKFLK